MSLFALLTPMLSRSRLPRTFLPPTITCWPHNSQNLARTHIMSSRTMKSTSLHRTFVLAMAVAVFVLGVLSLPEAEAYMQGPKRAFKPRIRCVQSTSALSAWSLSAPAFSTPSLGASWYNEVDPTGRRTVYDDTPLDYTFSAPGDDWPSVFDSSPQMSRQTRSTPRRINPLRRAAKWALGRSKNEPSQP